MGRIVTIKVEADIDAQAPEFDGVKIHDNSVFGPHSVLGVDLDDDDNLVYSDVASAKRDAGLLYPISRNLNGRFRLAAPSGPFNGMLEVDPTVAECITVDSLISFLNDYTEWYRGEVYVLSLVNSCNCCGNMAPNYDTAVGNVYLSNMDDIATEIALEHVPGAEKSDISIVFIWG